MPESQPGNKQIVDDLSSYIARAAEQRLPDEVREMTSLHVLDTIAAIISGASLRPGRLGIAFALEEQSRGKATVIGSGTAVSPSLAAFSNGISAHADETDDNHAALVHPGCAVVPAALAVGEHWGCSGNAFLRSVALGYDAAIRMALALGPSNADPSGETLSRSSIAGGFGAAASAGALAGFDATQVRRLLTYWAHQASGFWSVLRDEAHVSKAFGIAGMPARNGVWAAQLVRSGFTAELDVLDGTPGYLSAISREPRLDMLTEELGQRWEMLRSNIKKYCVGGPLQPVVEAVCRLAEDQPIAISELAEINVLMPPVEAYIVGSRSAPDIDTRSVVATTLVRGGLTFADIHDPATMADPVIAGLKEKVRVGADPKMASLSKQARVELVDKFGSRRSCHVDVIRGRADNPMSRSEVEEKARDLICPVTGAELGEELISELRLIDNMNDLTSITKLLASVEVKN